MLKFYILFGLTVFNVTCTNYFDLPQSSSLGRTYSAVFDTIQTLSVHLYFCAHLSCT